METHGTKSSPAGPPSQDQRIQRVVDWWMALEMSGDAGASSWEVLTSLGNEVTACLCQDPPDVARAESITARAMLAIEGDGSV